LILGSTRADWLQTRVSSRPDFVDLSLPMGPLKKKHVRSTVTLHDFFDPGATSLGKQKIKSQTTQSNLKGTRSGTVSLQPEDIIVIDSDSDDAPSFSQVQRTQRTKKRKLSGSSDEVEFVDQVQPHRGKLAAQASKRAIKSAGDKTSTKKPFTFSEQITFGEPTGVSSSCPQEVAFPSFGTPSLLFPAPSHPPLSSTLSTSPSFGSPTLLSSTGDQLLEPKHNQPPSCPSSASDVQNISDVDSSNMDFELSTHVFDEDWGTGDDEIAFEQSADDEGDDVCDSTISAPLDLSGTVVASNFIQVLYFKAYYSLGHESRPWRLSELNR
jgi:hypothetical protein